MAEVDDRLRDGWRPSKHQERLWVRGGSFDPDTEEEKYNESEPMTAEEEQALITRQYVMEASAEGVLRPVLVEDQGGS